MTLRIEVDTKVVSEIDWEVDFHKLEFDVSPSSFFAVVDSNARWFYEERIASAYPDMPVFLFEDPEEANKSQETVNELLEFLFQCGADRSSALFQLRIREP